MNDINDIIQKLYDNLVNVVTEGFEEQEKIFVKEEFLRVIKNRYSRLTEITINDYNTLYEKLFKLQYEEWSNLSIDMKKHILLKDNALDEIINIASNAYKFAKERLNNNVLILPELAEQYIAKLNELYELVKDYNKQLANWHISEGTMDLKYSSGQTESMSMRVGHLK